MPLEKAAVGQFGELLKEGTIGVVIDGWLVIKGVDPEEIADFFIACFRHRHRHRCRCLLETVAVRTLYQ